MIPGMGDATLRDNPGARLESKYLFIIISCSTAGQDDNDTLKPIQSN